MPSKPPAKTSRTALAARDVFDACLCLHLQRATRVVTRLYDDALRPVGLTSGQFSLLMSLERPTAPSMRQLAAELAMDRTTLTACLKPLDRRGLIRSDADDQDARSRLLSLTDAGRAVLAEALPAWRHVQRQTIARPLPLDASSLRAGLRALAA